MKIMKYRTFNSSAEEKKLESSEDEHSHSSAFSSEDEEERKENAQAWKKMLEPTYLSKVGEIKLRMSNQIQ